MDYSKIPTSALLFDELPGLCRCGVDCTDSILREQILAEIDRRIPVPTAPKLDGWQPVDTAPKDGTRVLMYGAATCRMGSIIEIVWYEAFNGGGSWDYGDGYTMRNPLGWMPLPEVPR